MANPFRLFRSPLSQNNPFREKTPAGTIHNALMIVLGSLLALIAFLHHESPSDGLSLLYNVLAICLVANTLYFGLIVRQITTGNRAGAAFTYFGRKAVVASIFCLFVEASLIYYLNSWH